MSLRNFVALQAIASGITAVSQWIESFLFSLFFRSEEEKKPSRLNYFKDKIELSEKSWISEGNWCHSGFSEKPSVKSGVKTSQIIIIIIIIICGKRQMTEVIELPNQ